MTTEQQRLERKIARLTKAIDKKTMTPSQRQAARLGVRPAEADDRDASEQQAARLGIEGDR
ncbi:hypothetical protein [Agrococcus beijingensis]|uniref:hypothetical protein n=1 Tax=Agrococcus beijingensis TaxID=3068634 RepID=UPI0027426A25|nr:hypothetical protein [Agrococcus sp. REN33]